MTAVFPSKTHKTNGQPTKRYLRWLMQQEHFARYCDEMRLWSKWCAKMTAERPADVKDWTLQDARTTADIIKAFDEIRHRYGYCDHSAAGCLLCDALLESKGGAP